MKHVEVGGLVGLIVLGYLILLFFASVFAGEIGPVVIVGITAVAIGASFIDWASERWHR